MTPTDKVVVITGVTGALGEHVAHAFLATGCKVAGLVRGSSIAGLPGDPNFAAFPADLGSRAGAEAAVTAVRSRWGRVDALVHLAGAFAGGMPVTETGEDVFDRMLAVNLKPFLHAAQAVLPLMQEQRSGAVLAIGSRAAVEPQAGLSAYAASKAALISLVGTIARENRPFGISANVVLPGTMDTPANRSAMPAADFSKWVRPEQVAAMLVHLCSEEASQISGAAIPIYGGEL